MPKLLMLEVQRHAAHCLPAPLIYAELGASASLCWHLSLQTLKAPRCARWQ